MVAAFTEDLCVLLVRRRRIFEEILERVCTLLSEYSDSRNIDRDNCLWRCNHTRKVVFITCVRRFYRIFTPCEIEHCRTRQERACPEFSALVGQLMMCEVDYAEALSVMDTSELDDLPNFSFSYDISHENSYSEWGEEHCVYHGSARDFENALRRPDISRIELSCTADYKCEEHARYLYILIFCFGN